ncbi:MAG: hypothetical protein RR140_02400 [Clostridia bacterium]
MERLVCSRCGRFHYFNETCDLEDIKEFEEAKRKEEIVKQQKIEAQKQAYFAKYNSAEEIEERAFKKSVQDFKDRNNFKLVGMRKIYNIFYKENPQNDIIILFNEKYLKNYNALKDLRHYLKLLKKIPNYKNILELDFMFDYDKFFEDCNYAYDFYHRSRTYLNNYESIEDDYLCAGSIEYKKRIERFFCPYNLFSYNQSSAKTAIKDLELKIAIANFYCNYEEEFGKDGLMVRKILLKGIVEIRPNMRTKTLGNLMLNYYDKLYDFQEAFLSFLESSNGKSYAKKYKCFEIDSHFELDDLFKKILKEINLKNDNNQQEFTI